MSASGGISSLVQQLVSFVTDAFHDPSTLLRYGIWGAVGICALILFLFVIPVGLLCLAYYMVSRSKKQGTAVSGDGGEKTADETKAIMDDSETKT